MPPPVSSDKIEPITSNCRVGLSFREVSRHVVKTVRDNGIVPRLQVDRSLLITVHGNRSEEGWTPVEEYTRFTRSSAAR